MELLDHFVLTRKGHTKSEKNCQTDRKTDRHRDIKTFPSCKFKPEGL